MGHSGKTNWPKGGIGVRDYSTGNKKKENCQQKKKGMDHLTDESQKKKGLIEKNI